MRKYKIKMDQSVAVSFSKAPNGFFRQEVQLSQTGRAIARQCLSVVVYKIEYNASIALSAMLMRDVDRAIRPSVCPSLCSIETA